MISAKAAGIIPILFLAACATAPEPQVKTVTVQVPVRVACVPADITAPPVTYADADAKAAPDAAERYRLIAAANAQRTSRLAILEPVVKACR